MNEIAGGTRTKWRGKPLAFALIGLAVFGLFLGRSLYYHPSDPYETYYRLIIDLFDKKGRPVGIDVVVGCGVHRGHSIGGGSIFEVMDMDSAFYAWAIPDGHALSVRTSPSIAASDTCSGATTDNGKVARDWLPFIIWYDDASDLSHGLGYATQDAYNNKRAQLVFTGARILKATLAEYKQFKEKGPKNLLPPHLSDARIDYTKPTIIDGGAEITPEMIASPIHAWKVSDWLSCLGVIKSPIPKSIEHEIAKIRPQSAQKYWSYRFNLQNHIAQKLPYRDETSGGGFMRPDTPEWNAKRPKVYLQTFDGNLDSLNKATFASGTYRMEAKIIPENLGFMDCGRPAPQRLISAVIGRQMTIRDQHTITCFIDGIQVSDTGWCGSTNAAFENTKYFITQTHRLQD